MTLVHGLGFQRDRVCATRHVVLVQVASLTSDQRAALGPVGFVMAEHNAQGYLVHDCGAQPSCPLEESC